MRFSCTCTGGENKIKDKVWWKNVPLAPPDAILGVTQAFRKDPSPMKVNLGVGAYRDNTGKPFVLGCVRKVEKMLLDAKDHNHEYIPQTGLAEYNKVAKELAFGPDGVHVPHSLVVTAQSISGTGALRLGAAFIKKFYASQRQQPTEIYIPNPTWGNHRSIFSDAGFGTVKNYAYYSTKTNSLDFEGMIKDLSNAPEGSVVLLHACAHNPTGMDPTPEQWKIISETVKSRGHLVFFDCAYQGFASGDPERDVAPIRMFLKDGHKFLISQSFAKNFGLYGERVGTISVVCSKEDEAKCVESQISTIIRAMYSSPALFGARIVHGVLSNPALREEWHGDVRAMADRITTMRSALVNSLAKSGSTRDWSHVTRQIGMFSFTGLTEAQCLRMKDKHHIYMTKDGRISMAGINTGNVDYVANAIHEVTSQI